MGLGGGRRYGHGKKGEEPIVSSPAIPTYVCHRCGKVRAVTPKTVTLTGVVDNALFLTARICEECGKLLQDWLKK